MKKLFGIAAAAVLVLAAAADYFDRKTGREPVGYEAGASVSGGRELKSCKFIYAAQCLRPVILGNFFHQALRFLSGALQKVHKWKIFWKS